MKDPKKIKRAIVIASVAALFVALTAGYFFFPAPTKEVITHTVAIAAQSWNDTFGMSRDEYVTAEVDLGDGSTSASTSAPASSEGISMLSSEPQTATDTARTLSDVATSSVPVLPPASDTLPNIVPTDDMNAALAATATTTVSTTTSSSQLCDLTAAIASAAANPSHKVILNEVAWMGSVPLGDETALKASNREWIELKNISGGGVDLTGWQILDTAGNLKIIFGGGDHIAAGGFHLLARGSADASGTVPGVTVDKTYSGALVNTGDTLVLFDANCGVSDRFDASSSWPGGDNATKQTLERNADGVGWHTSVPVGGTPRAENSIPVIATGGGGGSGGGGNGGSGGGSGAVAETTGAGTGAASTTAGTATSTTTSTTQPCGTVLDHLVIAEVQIAGTASTNDFVKIFNPTAGSIDVSGWKLRKRSKSGAEYSLRVFPSAASLAPGAYFLWANATDGFGATIGANVTSTETLAADNSVALLNASSAIVDMVAWGTGSGQYVEAAAYPTNPQASQVLKRKFAGSAIVDTDNNADDFTL